MIVKSSVVPLCTEEVHRDRRHGSLDRMVPLSRTGTRNAVIVLGLLFALGVWLFGFVDDPVPEPRPAYTPTGLARLSR